MAHRPLQPVLRGILSEDMEPELFESGPGLDGVRTTERGLDSGQERETLSGGGAGDAYAGGETRVEGTRKTSYLFLDLLDRLVRAYPQARCLHVILDNYRIHSSDIAHAALAGYLAAKVELHFLPPYCPDDNAIERVWQDLHANVTRNPRCTGMSALMEQVRYYLRKRNRHQIKDEVAA